MTSVNFAANILFDNTLEDAFPEVDPNHEPFGSRVLVQFLRPKRVTKGGIHVVEETRNTLAWNTQVAKVVAIGPGAFKDRINLQDWPEGPWAKVGDYVRVPKFGGDRFEVMAPDGEPVLLAQFNDLDLGGHVPDPLRVMAFV